MESLKSRLARGYSRAAPLYEALAAPMYAMGIRKLLPRLRPMQMPAILDVGCGTGVNMVEAARWFGPTRLLCGIDLSPGMVEVARAKTAGLGLPAHFTIGDAEKLPYPDATFDLVICNSVLHWFKDRGAALREMRRVLRPGGQTVIICAASPGFQEWFGLMDTLLKTALGPSASVAMPAFPTAVGVALHMQSAGFMLEHIANPTCVQRITDPESFIRLMNTVAPQWTVDLPEGTIPLLEHAAATLLRCGWPAGFPNTWSAVEAIGTNPV